MCILAGWKNNYASKYNWFSYANGGVAFTTTEVPVSKGKKDNML